MSLNDFCIGKEVLARTFSAGVWFGTLSQKEGKEIILTDARRVCNEGLPLYSVVAFSDIAPAVPQVWLEVIEILPMEGEEAENIRMAEYKA